MPYLALTFTAVALCVTAVLLAASLRLRGSSFVIAAYVIGWACVVGIGEALSVFDALGRTGYIVGSALPAAAAVAVWHQQGRPMPSLSFPRVADLKAHPQVALLGGVILGAVGYQAFVVVATPPNNYDSLTYHLTRVVGWLQQGHVGYFDAATQRANAFPGDAELGILATIALLGRDTLAALPQLIAELAIIACVYGIARRLGFRRPAAVFAALLTATLGEIALESVTTQNDLVVASFVVACVYFVLGREQKEMPLAGLAAALAVGTKLTGPVALPILVVVAVAWLPRRRLAELAVCGVVAFAAFGAFWYIENTIRTGHPLGTIQESAQFEPDRTASGTVSTVARIYWRFVDFTGAPRIGFVERSGERVGSELFAIAHIPANPAGTTANEFVFEPPTVISEDTSYFGVLGFLLVVPLSVGFAVAWLCRRTSRPRGLVALALPLFVLATALTQTYSFWLGRFMTIPVALTMPLAAWLYDRNLRPLTLLVVLIGCAGLFGTHLGSPNKPTGILEGTTPLWALPRADAQSRFVGTANRQAALVVNRTIPADAELGVVLGHDDPSYLLYGPRLKRRLVALPAQSATRDAAARGIRWIVTSPRARGVVSPAPGWEVRAIRGGWELFTRRAPQPAPSS